MLSAQIYLSLVLVHHEPEADVGECRGTTAGIRCTTTTADGFLLWRNSNGSGKGQSFSNNAHVNASRTLGSVRMILNKIQYIIRGTNNSNINAVIYTSTAYKDNIMENTTIWCSDGEATENIVIHVKSKPAWDVRTSCNNSVMCL